MDIYLLLSPFIYFFQSVNKSTIRSYVYSLHGLQISTQKRVNVVEKCKEEKNLKSTDKLYGGEILQIKYTGPSNHFIMNILLVNIFLLDWITTIKKRISLSHQKMQFCDSNKLYS